MNDKYHAWSDWEIQSIKDISTVKTASIPLGKIKMKGQERQKLAYKFIGDVSEITKRDQGTCVIDHLVYECVINPNFKSWNRQKLISFFGEKSVRRGISADEIVKWAKHVKYVNVVSLNPFFESFMTHSVYHETSRAYTTIVLVCNNNHDYPIIDPNIKKEIMRKGRMDIADFIFDIQYTEHHYIDARNEEDCYSQFKNNKSKIVLCELHDLCKLANKVITDTSFMVTQTDFNGSSLRAFVHPVTNQILISAEDYKQRNFVCGELYKTLTCETFKFKNQSWTQLAKDYFKNTYGEIPQSSLE